MNNYTDLNGQGNFLLDFNQAALASRLMPEERASVSSHEQRGVATEPQKDPIDYLANAIPTGPNGCLVEQDYIRHPVVQQVMELFGPGATITRIDLEPTD